MRLPWRIPSFGPAIESSLTEREAAELQRLGALKRVLEVGAAFGYSTVVLAEVAVHVISVDPHEVHGSLDIHTANLERYGVTAKVGRLVGPSMNMLPALDDHQFDLVFVDGDHTAAGVSFDLGEALRLVVVGGTLAFHDWNEESCPGVRIALEAWRTPDYIIDTLAVYRLA